MLILSFLVLHFYAFITFLVAFSFIMFAELQLSERRNLYGIMREKREKLDEWVTAVHLARKSVLKRRIPVFRATETSQSVSNHSSVSSKQSISIDSSSESDSAFGVSRTNHKRLRSLGFQPKLLSYERKSEIYVPEISPDSKRCDMWNQFQNVRYLVKCKPSEGEQACFNCIESRKFVRKCVHISRPLQISLDYAFGNVQQDSTVATQQTDYIMIPANENPDEGYCLPRVFANIEWNEGSWRPADESRNCNPNTGEWLLSRLSITGDTSYNWLCRCRYPNLMTNLSTIFSDCLRPVGCNPNGELDEAAKSGRVNPFTMGRCVCNAGYKSDYDRTIGPTCVPLVVVSEDNLPQDVYASHNLDTTYMLEWPKDEKYLDYRVATIGGNTSRGVALPNPCKYDALTFKPLPPSSACELVSELIQDEYVAYCVIYGPMGAPVRSSRDYLRNNNGRYSNGCIRVQVGELGWTDTVNAILSYQVTRDYRNARPDFGVLYASSPPLNDLLAELKEKDENYKKFMENVENPGMRFNSLYDMNIKIADQNIIFWLSLYEQVPLESKQLNGMKKFLLQKAIDGEMLLYNLRERSFFWYCVRNPLGSDHWNNGTREDISFAANVAYPGIVLPTPLNLFVPPKAAFTLDLQDFKQPDFVVGENDYSVTGPNGLKVPPPRFVIPFASGSDIDTPQFASQYYPTLFPIFKRRKQLTDEEKEKVMDIPFVYNAGYTHSDSTLTLHLYNRNSSSSPRQSVYLMGERLCGQYKNHYSRMRFKQQGDLV